VPGQQRAFYLAVTLSLVLLAPASWAPRVTGVVVSGKDAAPVAGVVITLLDERDQTRTETLGHR
jgi:hypothetical protein